MIALLAGIPWGAVLGALAGFWQRREERELLKIQHAQQVELLRLQQAGAINAAEWAGFTASHTSAASEDGRGVWNWVKSIRYGIRSFLTLFLVVAAVVVAWRAGSGSDLPARIVFFAEMALGWHFGWKAKAAGR